MSGVQQRLPSLLDDPIAFGHRGARAHAPENTLAAFELALNLGANGSGERRLAHRRRRPRARPRRCASAGVGRTRPIGEIAVGAAGAHPDARRPDRRAVAPTTTCRSTSRTPASGEVGHRCGRGAAAPEMLPRLWLCAPTADVARPARPRRPTGRFDPIVAGSRKGQSGAPRSCRERASTRSTCTTPTGPVGWSPCSIASIG